MPECRACLAFDDFVASGIVCLGDTNASRIPTRNVPLAPGCDIHAIGAWPEHDIEGT